MPHLYADGAELVLLRLHVLLEVEGAVLEDQVQLALLRHVEHVLQLDDVRVVELLEEANTAGATEIATQIRNLILTDILKIVKYGQ